MIHFGKAVSLGRFLMIPTVLVAASVPNPCNASGWDASYSYSGTNTVTVPGMPDQVTNWNSGPFPLRPQHLACVANAGVPSTGGTVSASSIGSITVTLTWHRVANDMNDKPPLKVMVKQTCTAGTTGTFMGFSQPPGAPPPSCTYSGSLSNGLGSPVTTTTTATSRSSNCAGPKVLEFKSPQDYDRDAMDPITITIPAIQVRAFVSGTGNGGQINTQTGIDYSVSVITWHAHPTNYHKTSGTENSPGPGQLTFGYNWDSTSGNLADLGQCRLGEWVTYDGNTGIYLYNVGNYTDIPQGPIAYGNYAPGVDPYVVNGSAQGLLNPERGVMGGGWALGSATTGHLTDVHSPLNMSTNYPSATVAYSANQVYGYRCDVCMSSDPPSYFEVLLNVGSIVRTFKQVTPPPNGTWLFQITKSGLTGTKNFP